jgi:hypothetical protein
MVKVSVSEPDANAVTLQLSATRKLTQLGEVAAAKRVLPADRPAPAAGATALTTNIAVAIATATAVDLRTRM